MYVRKVMGPLGGRRSKAVVRDIFRAWREEVGEYAQGVHVLVCMDVDRHVHGMASSRFMYGCLHMGAWVSIQVPGMPPEVGI